MKKQARAVVYKVSNSCDKLTIGDIYDARESGRFVQFTSRRTGDRLSLYKWQVTQGLACGALHVLCDAQADVLNCAVGDKLCKHTANGFAY